MLSEAAAQRIETWPIPKLVFYAKNPRKNAAAVDRMVASIQHPRFREMLASDRVSVVSKRLWGDRFALTTARTRRGALTTTALAIG